MEELIREELQESMAEEVSGDFSASDIALALAPKFSAFLSIGGSSYIIGHVIHSGQAMKSTQHRLLLGMSACNLLVSSLAFFMSTWPIPEDEDVFMASGNQATCDAQGFFTQFSLAVVMYNASLSAYYCAKIKYQCKTNYIRSLLEPLFHSIPLCIGMGTALAGVFFDLYNNNEYDCWIAAWPQDCDESWTISSDNGDEAEACLRGDNASIYRWAFFYGPLWLAILFVAVNMVGVYRTVYGQEKKMNKYNFEYQHTVEEIKRKKLEKMLSKLEYEMEGENGGAEKRSRRGSLFGRRRSSVGGGTCSGGESDDNDDDNAAECAPRPSRFSRKSIGGIGVGSGSHESDNGVVCSAPRQFRRSSIGGGGTISGGSDDSAPLPCAPRRFRRNSLSGDVGNGHASDDGAEWGASPRRRRFRRLSLGGGQSDEDDAEGDEFAAPRRRRVRRNSLGGATGDCDDDSAGSRVSKASSRASKGMRRSLANMKKQSFRIINTVPRKLKKKHDSLKRKHDALKAHFTNSNRVARQAYWFCGAFLATWFFPTIYQLVRLAGHKDVYALQFLTAVFVPIQGFFQCLVYVHHRIRKKHIRKVCCCGLYKPRKKRITAATNLDLSQMSAQLPTSSSFDLGLGSSRLGSSRALHEEEDEDDDGGEDISHDGSETLGPPSIKSIKSENVGRFSMDSACSSLAESSDESSSDDDDSFAEKSKVPRVDISNKSSEPFNLGYEDEYLDVSASHSNNSHLQQYRLKGASLTQLKSSLTQVRSRLQSTLQVRLPTQLQSQSFGLGMRRSGSSGTTGNSGSHVGTIPEVQCQDMNFGEHSNNSTPESDRHDLLVVDPEIMDELDISALDVSTTSADNAAVSGESPNGAEIPLQGTPFKTPDTSQLLDCATTKKTSSLGPGDNSEQSYDRDPLDVLLVEKKQLPTTDGYQLNAIPEIHSPSAIPHNTSSCAAEADPLDISEMLADEEAQLDGVERGKRSQSTSSEENILIPELKDYSASSHYSASS